MAGKRKLKDHFRTQHCLIDCEITALHYFFLFLFSPQNKDNYRGWPAIAFILKEKHHHIRFFSNINMGLSDSISLTALVYENSTSYHDVTLHGKPETLLQAQIFFYLGMTQTKGKSLMGRCSGCSPIIKSWNHLFVTNQTALLYTGKINSLLNA